MQRARSESAKLEREDSILTATEMLLRQSGYDSMTMQAVATAAGLAKGTLYLYFASRESLVIAVYGRLFDRWIDRFAVHKPELNGFDGFCRDFARHYSDDPLFLQLSIFINSLAEPQLDREAFINGKRAMARRVKRLAGFVCQQFFIEPVAAQKLIWGFLTIAGTKDHRHNATRNHGKNRQNRLIQADEQQNGQSNDQTTGHKAQELVTHGW